MNVTSELLRQVADVIETSGVRFSHVCIGGVHVRIDDIAFEQMFQGCVLTGKRRSNSNYVETIGEKYGIMWASQLWRPSPKKAEAIATERIVIANATVQPEPVFAIDGE
jgi:hypothetical protein